MKRSLTDLIELLVNINIKTKHDVMFEYLGHTEDFIIRFFENGWEVDIDPTEKYRFYLNENGAGVKVNMIYERFLKILKEGDS